MISLCIGTYLERNQKYLDLCIDSILKQNLPIPFEIIVVSSGSYVPHVPKADNIKLIHKPEQTHYPQAMNIAVENSNQDYKYLMCINDDVLFTKNSIVNMLNTMGDNELIMNPISTSDNGWRYHLPLGYIKNGTVVNLPERFYTYEKLQDAFEDIFNNSIPLPRGLFFVPFTPLYCTLIPRIVWNKVGTLDGNFWTGQDDVDYSYRAKLLGIRSVVSLDSFVVHFGGSTATFALTDDIRNRNLAYFLTKWRNHTEIFSWL